MIRILLTFIFVSASGLPTSSSVHADEREIRLDQPPYSMQHVPFSKQYFPDCYAETGAKLIDAYRFSHGDSRIDFQTSSLVLATDAKLAIHQHSVAAGKTCGAIEITKEKGYCNDVVLQLNHKTIIDAYMFDYAARQKSLSDLISFRRVLDEISKEYRRESGLTDAPAPPVANVCDGHPQAQRPKLSLAKFVLAEIACPTEHANFFPGQGPFSEIMALVHFTHRVEQELVKLTRSLSISLEKTHYFANSLKALRDSNGLAAQIVKDLIQGGYSPDSLPSLAKLESILTRDESVDLIKAVTEKTCKGANLIRPNLPPCHSLILPVVAHASICNLPKNANAIEHAWATKYAQKISRLFDKPNPQPVAIQFCPDIIPLRQYNTHYPMTGQTCSDTHSALIIGRRINAKTGRLNFLIRESREMISKKETSDPHKWMVSPVWDTEGNGTLWIDAEALIKNTFGVESFVPLDF